MMTGSRLNYPDLGVEIRSRPAPDGRWIVQHLATDCFPRRETARHNFTKPRSAMLYMDQLRKIYDELQQQISD